MTHPVAVNWFEIPATDLDRATAFYRAVLDADIAPMDMPGVRMQAFVSGGRPVGAIVEAAHAQPSDHGPLIYLAAANSVGEALARVETAGGRIVQPSTAIGSYGVVGQFLDTEGNRLAFHALQ